VPPPPAHVPSDLDEPNAPDDPNDFVVLCCGEARPSVRQTAAPPLSPSELRQQKKEFR
jgi:hypothetical protein